jgi:sorbose reductase
MVVTGGAGTLALEASRALLEHGLSGLALLDITPSQSEASIGKLKTDFPEAKIIIVEVNITDAGSVEKAMQDAKDQLGCIDILGCFAGVVQCLPSESLKTEEWKRVLDINTTGTWFCCQAAAKYARLS